MQYELLTDPGQLQVSGAGKNEESPGTVHIVVSNPGDGFVEFRSLKVVVPYGAGEGALTVDPGRIKARLSRNTWQDAHLLTSHWDPATATFTLETSAVLLVDRGESLVVELNDFPVSPAEGLSRLSLKEVSTAGTKWHEYRVTLSVLKRAPKVPRNFRAERTLLAATENVVLRWDGPENLDYRIQDADGGLHPVQGQGTEWTWSPNPGDAPRRDATYTLIATPKAGQQPGYFLTTTVHLRTPEFEAVTATNGLHTPWAEGTVQHGRITFTDQGATILDQNQAPGTVSAADARVETVTATTGVHTPWVQGTAQPGRIALTGQGAQVLDRNQGAGTLSAGTVDAEAVIAAVLRGRDGDGGWIRFPSDGITVGHGSGSALGTVTADRVRVNGVNTPWVGDVDGGKGWIEFPQSGVNIRKDGTQTWGDVSADKADLNGVNTKWVQGPSASDGWIEFPAAGLNVFQGAGSRQWGTVAAATADLNDLTTDRARVKERLTLQGGLTVPDILETQDGPPRLIVHGRLDAEGEVHAGQSVVTGDLTAKGILRVFGESSFRGKVNANAHLSVRGGNAWIVHTNDGQVVVNGDLRVHGASRSDS
ncbi:hypothetical protein BU197_26990 [Streptomyces sp. CBMA291]|nr:hypothetical protein [Streptomyces sp. CBMA291]